MKKLVVLAAMSTALVSGAALAGGPEHYQAQQPGAIYAGVAGGVAVPAGDATVPGFPTNTGWDVNGHAGYRFNKNFRVEGAITYLRQSVTGLTQDHANQLFFMVNGLYDIPLANHLTPFFGLGAGVVRMWGTDTNGVDLTGKTNEFAYQGIAGIAYNFTQRVSVNVAYHAMSWTTFPGFQNLVNAGVDYTF